MKELRNPKWIVAKGFLFLMLGLLAGVAVLFADSKPKQALFLAVTVWAFCRFYYFAFYVIERYVDPTYRFSGLWSLALYLIRKRAARTGDNPRTNEP